VQCTPLHYAVIAGNDVVVETLIHAGADPSARGPGGMTPLHYAFHGNSRINLRVVQHLLHARAGPSARDVNGDTPLYFAMSNDCVDFAILQTPVLLLLQHDASLLNSVIGGYSQRPLEVALCLGGPLYPSENSLSLGSRRRCSF
jgi:ankyrin repeat protein